MDLYERGLVVPYTSSEDTSIPDCGMHIGLGNGRAIYAGEVSDALLKEYGLQHEGASWALCIRSENELRPVATIYGDWHEILEAFDQIAAALKALGSK